MAKRQRQRPSMNSHAHGLGTKQPSVPSFGTFQTAVPPLPHRTETLVTNFCIFTVQQRCKHLSCLLFTSVYNLGLLLYTHISLLYT